MNIFKTQNTFIGNRAITPADYVEMVRNGASKDVVLKVREIQQAIQEFDAKYGAELTEEQASIRSNLENEKRFYKGKSKFVITYTLKEWATTRQKKDLHENPHSVIWLDLDHIPASILGYVFETLKRDRYISCLHKSISGDGLKGLVSVKDISKNGHAWMMKKVLEYYEMAYEHISLGMYLDHSGKDAARGAYLSYDEDIYVNENVEPLDVEELRGYCESSKKNLDERRWRAKTERGGKTKQKKTSSEDKTRIRINPEDFNAFNQSSDVEDAIIKAFTDFGFNGLDDGSGRNDFLFRLICRLASFGIDKELLIDCLEHVMLNGFNAKSYWAENSAKILDMVERASVGIPVIFDNTYTATIDINQYCTEKTDLLTKYLNFYSKSLLVAPTGSGKTVFIMEYLYNRFVDRSKALDKKFYYVYITPNVLPAENIYNTTKRFDPLDIDDRKIGELELLTGTHGFNKGGLLAGNSSIVIMVPDQLDNFVNGLMRIHNVDESTANEMIEFVVLDELHKIEDEVSFRKCMEKINPFLTNTKRVVSITATPTLGWWEFVKEYNWASFLIEPKIKQKVNVNYYNDADYELLLEVIEQSLSKNHIPVVRFSSKKALSMIRMRLMKKLGLRLSDILLVTSDSKTTEKCRRFSTTGLIKEKVVLCTKILEDGFSIINDEQLDMFFISETRENINPGAIKQFSARGRKNSVVNLNIFRKLPEMKEYGQDKLFESIISKVIAEFARDTERVIEFSDVKNTVDYDWKTRSTNLGYYKKRATRDNKVHVLSAINEVTKIRLGEIKGAGMFLNALQSYFEEGISFHNIEKTAESKESEKIDKAIIGEIMDETVEYYMKQSYDLSFFFDLYKANVKDKGYKAFDFYCTSHDIMMSEKALDGRGLDKEDYMGSSVNAFLKLYIRLFKDTSNHESKMNFIENLVKNKLTNKLTTILTHYYYDGRNYATLTPRFAADFSIELALRRLMEGYVEQHGYFWQKGFVGMVKESFPKLLNFISPKSISDLYVLIFNPKRSKAEIDGKRVDVYKGGKLSSREDIVKEFEIDSHIEGLLFDDQDEDTKYLAYEVKTKMEEKIQENYRLFK